MCNYHVIIHNILDKARRGKNKHLSSDGFHFGKDNEKKTGVSTGFVRGRSLGYIMLFVIFLKS